MSVQLIPWCNYQTLPLKARVAGRVAEHCRIEVPLVGLKKYCVKFNFTISLVSVLGGEEGYMAKYTP